MRLEEEGIGRMIEWPQSHARLVPRQSVYTRQSPRAGCAVPAIPISTATSPRQSPLRRAGLEDREGKPWRPGRCRDRVDGGAGGRGAPAGRDPAHPVALTSRTWRSRQPRRADGSAALTARCLRRAEPLESGLLVGLTLVRSRRRSGLGHDDTASWWRVGRISQRAKRDRHRENSGNSEQDQ
jgi:hypothetical protein